LEIVLGKEFVMEIVIVFETVEGQTKKIVEYVEKQISDAGHTVKLHNTSDRSEALSVENADRIILAAPVHERRHPENFEVLVSAGRDELKKRPTLLISVSLKAAFAAGLEEAQDYLTELEMRTGFTPDKQALVAGAVRPNNYGYYESQIVQHVVLDGQDVSLKAGGNEFTDWSKLSAEIDSFLKMDG
jgi:menaquinone-dependent protoporphyrinogen oxidase